jgi:ABC-type nitrate/sulfonate/bicarbonate transport system substrate-binding protein
MNTERENMTRWQFAIALAFTSAVTVLSTGVQAQEPKPVKVRFGVLTTASQAAFTVGVQAGIFRKYGFEVEVIPLGTGAQANQALAANQVDWSGGGIESTVVAWATGLPFKAYAMYAKGGDSYGILVRKDANITKAEDLRGKKVAVPQGPAPAQGLNQVVRRAGLPADSVKRVNATYGNMGQMLVQGSVDAMVGLEPFLTLTENVMEGKASMLMRLGEYVQGGGFFLITDSWANANPDRVLPAVQALWESQQWLRKNHKEATEIEATYLKVKPDDIGAAFKWLKYDPLVDEFTRQSIKTTSEYLAGEGLIAKPIDAEANLKALDKVTAELKTKAAS